LFYFLHVLVLIKNHNSWTIVILGHLQGQCLGRIQRFIVTKIESATVVSSMFVQRA
jgi:hypothetical protein